MNPDIFEQARYVKGFSAVHIGMYFEILPKEYVVTQEPGVTEGFFRQTALHVLGKNPYLPMRAKATTVLHNGNLAQVCYAYWSYDGHTTFHREKGLLVEKTLVFAYGFSDDELQSVPEEDFVPQRSLNILASTSVYKNTVDLIPESL